MPMPKGCSLDELNIELEAMQTIARALAAVNDPEVRLRVLRWTNERFAGAPAGPAARAANASPTTGADPTLSVDGLHLFEDDGDAAATADEPAMATAVMTMARPTAAAATATPSDQPLDSLVRGFATDLRSLAMQWQSA
jgi:hypothetical protein